MKGIEINPFAAELARVSVWVGEIQWMKRNGFEPSKKPVLKPLETIECCDALLNPDGTEAEWPKADVIVGNPPFLGDRKLIDGLGEAFSEALRSRFLGRVPRGADLVCYWFEKSREALLQGTAHRFGLVATNSIRGGKNRVVLNRIAEVAAIFEAWSDEPWIVEGAAVRVSLICVQIDGNQSKQLDGRLFSQINADLTGGDLDLTRAQALRANKDVCLHGSKKIGAFDIVGDLARFLLEQPTNPNGRGNCDVIFPVWNGADVTGRPGERWIVDFGMSMTEAEAALYELPFSHLVNFVKPERLQNRNPVLVKKWWTTSRDEECSCQLEPVYRHSSNGETPHIRLGTKAHTAGCSANGHAPGRRHNVRHSAFAIP